MSLCRRQIKLPADGEQAIAKFLSTQPTPIKMAKAFIVGITRVAWQALALLLVRCRRHDQPMQEFDAALMGDEFTRKPIEQFGMSGWRAAYAKVVRRAHESPAEMVQPDSIDDHARCQRIGWRADPVRQLKSAADVWLAQLLSAKNFQPATRDRLAQLFGIAPQMTLAIRAVPSTTP